MEEICITSTRRAPRDVAFSSSFVDDDGHSNVQDLWDGQECFYKSVPEQSYRTMGASMISELINSQYAHKVLHEN